MLQDGLHGIGAALLVAGGIILGPVTAGASWLVVGAAIAKAGVLGFVTFKIAKGAGTWLSSKALPEDLDLPMFIISPEAIFQNEIPILDVNFFTPYDREGLIPEKEMIIDNNGNEKEVTKYYLEKTLPNGTKIKQESSAIRLQPTISRWYNALRNLAIVALLLILVYTAIRILISSAAEDRAKYKQRLLDWLIAMCLLFFMHYIMMFAVKITEEITKAVSNFNMETYYLIGDAGGNSETNKRKLSDYKDPDETKIFDKLDEKTQAEWANQYANEETRKGMSVGQMLYAQGIIYKQKIDDSGTEDWTIQWPTNLMGQARIQLQLEPPNMEEGQQLMRKFGYTVIYLALVIYTMLFLFRYLKRLLMLTFLTIIAPLMAMTYPLDKMRDGSAQGFNMWFKEYIYNLLIQPVHLILYTVLIGTAMDLVVDNLIYGLVALGFILQAEKLLRKFFGFDKASTVEGGSAFGGAMAMHALSSATKFLGRGGKDKKDKNGGKEGNDKNKNRNLNRGRDSGHGTEDLMDDVAGRTPLEAGNSNNTNPGGLNRMGANDGNLVPGTPNSALDKKGILGYGASKLGQIKPVKTLSKQASKAKDSISGLLDKNYNWRQGIYRAHPVVNALKNSAKTLGKGAKYIAPKAARFAASTALKTTMAGAGATIGLAAGLVSDDFSNVFKYGAAGLGGGWAAGSGLSKIPETLNGAGDRFDEGVEHLYEATHTQDEVEARQNAVLDKQWLKDSSVIDKYQDKLKVSRTEAKKIMKENAQRYREYGITDDDTIIKSMQAQGFGDDPSSKERILLATMASQTQNMKDLKSKEERLKRGGFSDDMVQKYSAQIMKMKNIT